MKRGCDLLILILKIKVKRSQPRFTRQLLQAQGDCFRALSPLKQAFHRTDGEMITFSVRSMAESVQSLNLRP